MASNPQSLSAISKEIYRHMQMIDELKQKQKVLGRKAIDKRYMAIGRAVVRALNEGFISEELFTQIITGYSSRQSDLNMLKEAFPFKKEFTIERAVATSGRLRKDVLFDIASVDGVEFEDNDEDEEDDTTDASDSDTSSAQETISHETPEQSQDEAQTQSPSADSNDDIAQEEVKLDAPKQEKQSKPAAKLRAPRKPQQAKKATPPKKVTPPKSVTPESKAPSSKAPSTKIEVDNAPAVEVKSTTPETIAEMDGVSRKRLTPANQKAIDSRKAQMEAERQRAIELRMKQIKEEQEKEEAGAESDKKTASEKKTLTKTTSKRKSASSTSKQPAKKSAAPATITAPPPVEDEYDEYDDDYEEDDDSQRGIIDPRLGLDHISNFTDRGRIVTILSKFEIYNLNDILTKTESEFYRIRGMAAGTVKTVKTILMEMNLDFRSPAKNKDD